MWIIWILCALAIISTVALAVIDRRDSTIGAWFALALINPFITVVKGVTALRAFSLALFAIVGVRDRNRSLALSAPAIIMFGLAIWSAITALWSPDPAAALTRALEWIIASAMLGLPWVLQNPLDRVGGIAKILTPVTLLAAITTIMFRILPSIERAFFESSLAQIMFSPKLVEDVRSGRVEANVLLGDGNKAGGILSSNANRTSLILGLATLAYLGIFVYLKHRYALITALISAAAVVATNSKTGIVMLAIAPILAFILWRSTQGLTRKNLAAVAGVLVPLAIIAGVGLTLFGSRFIAASAETLEPRKAIWATAFELIGQNPVFGSGAGSWELFWAPVSEKTGFSAAYPPHNFLLRSMIDLGAIGTVGIIAVIVLFMWTAFKQLRSSTSHAGRIAAALVIASWLWVVVHGLGDNTEYFGLLNNLPFLVLLSILARADNTVRPVLDLSVRAFPPQLSRVR
ncbi:O-antigen ligase family protein [Mycetocola lacteus]|uniref:O-antigen ligase family protein n=1 Tax=Mycetocola lacteus TaxID=76637 RepID=A0A3L7AU39_9MICO|nr:O-antigen ligase family protein [Mycetocola lacteus]RLP83674.1 O-antigen ligase family protein [Mycetocola lacteus]